MQRCLTSQTAMQMLGQSADAQALEKSVIEGYNSKLAARVASFQAAHTDVSHSTACVIVERALTFLATGRDVVVGFQRRVHGDSGQPNQVRLR